MVVSNDEYELPIMQFKSAQECGDHFGISANSVRQRVCRNGLINGNKIVSVSVKVNKHAYQKHYDMTHDRTEYFRELYRRKKACGEQ